jgi:hypothetical protein
MSIPRNLSKLADGADANGVLQPSNGGTGLTSYTAIYSNNYVFTATTTNATEVLLGSSTIPANKTAFWQLNVTARRTDVVGEYLAITQQGVAKLENGSLGDIGGIVEQIIYRSDQNASVECRVSGTNLLSVYATGPAAKTYAWRAVLTTQEA